MLLYGRKSKAIEGMKRTRFQVRTDACDGCGREESGGTG